MKRTIQILIVTLVTATLAACAPGSQQTAETAAPVDSNIAEQTQKAAIGVRTERHMKVALMSARQMLSGDATYRADHVTIVACGPGVAALQQDGGLSADIAKSVAMGVDISACGLTVEHMKIDPDTLADGVEVVPNGFVELIRLQSEGFYTIEL